VNEEPAVVVKLADGTEERWSKDEFDTAEVTDLGTLVFARFIHLHGEDKEPTTVPVKIYAPMYWMSVEYKL